MLKTVRLIGPWFILAHVIALHVFIAWFQGPGDAVAEMTQGSTFSMKASTQLSADGKLSFAEVEQRLKTHGGGSGHAGH